MQIKKSQVSMEFLFLIGFVFVIAFGFILAASYQLKEFSDDHERKLVDDFGNGLKAELSLASVVYDGYERNVVLPEKISQEIDYTITMQNTGLAVTTEKYSYSAVIPKTTGSLAKGNNTIRKQNGEIIIEN